MKIKIIGGGVIGLFSAYYLSKQGHEIHVFDQRDLLDGCSYGNAGMVTPSHFVPLAAPGVVAQGVRWMFQSASPFYIRPRLDGALLAWLWRFYRSCNRRQAEAAMPVLLDFNLLGKKLYGEFYRETGLDFHLRETGILMLYQTPKKEKEEHETARLAAKLGVETVAMNAAEVRDFEKGTAVKALGGVHYPGDAFMYPNMLMAHLKQLLVAQGVHFQTNRTVTGFEKKAGKVTALFADGEKFPADAFVVATGSWSGLLMKQLGVRLLMQDGKGYSFTLQKPAQRPEHATIFCEAKVAVTPMGDDLRFGGTLEISGHDPRINLARVRGIVDSIPKYYPELNVAMPVADKIWHGYRPCTPDGLPYIGRPHGFDNLILATGHAMMGLSLAPATGLMVSELLGNPALKNDFVRFFDPGR